MPERTLPDGTIEIYEEPGILGLQIPALTIDELIEIDERINKKFAEETAAQVEEDTPTEI